jgi:hypothetical protein
MSIPFLRNDLAPSAFAKATADKRALHSALEVDAEPEPEQHLVDPVPEHQA